MPSFIRSWRRAGAIVLCLLVLVLALACLSGPLFPFEPKPSDIAATVEHAPDLDAYLRRREAETTNVRPDLAKTITWYDPAARNKTPLVLVYLHGFSASRRDISPVIETLADKLAANAFATRLTAHGRTTPDGFVTATAQDWLDDAREALAIGRRIGDRVVLIGISTGALLATMAALEDKSSDIAALVLLSPNFAVRDWRGKFISGPVGPLLARVVIGKDYSFQPDSAGHAEFWTARYPSQAIVALMDLLNHARAIHLDTLKVPTLIIYTDKDTVVDVNAIKQRFDEVPGTAKLLVDLPGATRHELTGDALAPGMVQPAVERIAEFLAAHGAGAPSK
ncbi:MAG TPA: alpha/beta hydrolase [Xanthobacteraceae bacterium]|nr:alpha/beta hydrolase [Xanthobacteraceae bacterium]